MDFPGRAATGHDDFWDGPAGVWWHWPEVRVLHDAIEERWMVRPPCGHHFMLASGDSPHHVVEKGEDDKITVRPNPPAEPGNSNSILCPVCGWHGYIYDGIWRNI